MGREAPAGSGGAGAGARYESLIGSLERAGSLLIAVTIFSFITVFLPDDALLVRDRAITIPIFGVEAYFPAALAVICFVLVTICCYCYILDFEKAEIERLLRVEDHKSIFNLTGPVGGFVSLVIFFMMPALSLFALTYKAMARLDWGIPMVVLSFAFVFGQIYVLLCLRFPVAVAYRFLFFLLAPASLSLCIVFVLVAWSAPDKIRRGLRLEHADLARSNLFEARLPHADLSFSSLDESNLAAADLTEVDMFGASMRDADLEGTVLDRSTLVGVDLSNSNLLASSLHSSWLGGTSLANAYIRADLSCTKNPSVLPGPSTSFEKAAISGSSFVCAELRNSDFSDVSFLESSDFTCADLEGSKISPDIPGAYLCHTRWSDGEIISRDCGTERAYAVGNDRLHEVFTGQGIKAGQTLQSLKGLPATLGSCKSFCAAFCGPQDAEP
jgi:uncharacterized protein YjbI with pentapeptide repeats